MSYSFFQRPLPNFNNDCHIITTLHLLASMDVNIFSPEFLKVINYVRGNDNMKYFYDDFIAFMRNRLQDQQYDPNEDIEDFVDLGFIRNNMKIQNKYQPYKCNNYKDKVLDMSMILVAPDKKPDTLENLLNSRGLFQNITPSCSLQMTIKNPYGGRYLIIGIQRNENGEYKNRTPIFTNEIINVGNNLYKINAIIVHCGNNVDKGHYVIFLYNKYDNSWYLYDDNKEPLKINLNYMDFVHHSYKCGCGFFKNSGNIVSDATTLLYELV